MNKTWSVECTLHILVEIMVCRITMKRKNAARRTTYDIFEQKFTCLINQINSVSKLGAKCPTKVTWSMDIAGKIFRSKTVSEYLYLYESI